MTLGEFVAANVGKLVDFDGYYGPQCADLVQFYARDVLHAPPFAGENAINFYGEHPDRYDWIKNTPTNYPARGDIVVWNAAFGNGAGHIAIALSGTKDSFDSLDQNWGPIVTHIVHHAYLGVIGWGHPKGADDMDDKAYRKAAIVQASLTLGLPTDDATVNKIWPVVSPDLANLGDVVASMKRNAPKPSAPGTTIKLEGTLT